MVIKLRNDYVITADNDQFIIGKLRITKSDTKWQKAGEKVIKPQRFYNSLSGAIRGAIKILQREAVAESDISTFREAAEIFEHIKAEVEALVFPGEEDS